MTLASFNDRNTAKSERRLERAFRLVNHPVNLTPMWDGLLPSLDSTMFSGQTREHQKSHRNVPTNFKAHHLALCL
jgi:hypothetical protein